MKQSQRNQPTEPISATHPRAGRAREPEEASGGTRLSRIRVLSSVRFRLTAWYTLVLVMIIVVLGIMLSTTLSRSLENDVDDRLLQASTEAFNRTKTVKRSEGRYVGDTPNALKKIDFELTAEFSALVTSGLFIVAMDVARDIFYEQGGYPDEVLEQVNLDVISQSNAVFQTLSVNGQRLRVFSVPVFSPLSETEPDGPTPLLGAIVVGESLELQEHAIEQLNKLLRTGGAIGILVAMLSGWILAGRALAPVNKITNTANAIARKGDAQESLATRLEVGHSKDELARLAETFNHMLARIESAFHGQRRFVADASHELRTPLTAIRGNVDVLLRAARNDRSIEPDDLREALGDVQRESARMARLIEDLLLLARTDTEQLGHMVHPEPISLDVVAREAFRTAEALARGQRLHMSIRQPLMIHGDGDRLVQVIIILMENAIRHTPAGGTIDLVVDAAEPVSGEQTCARIKVVDSGEGIPPEHLPHLFERFYRVEGSRSRQAGGSGLGLSIALAIVQGHNGWIDVDNGKESGTHFAVWLPILESPEGASEPFLLTPGHAEAPEAEPDVPSKEQRYAD